MHRISKITAAFFFLLPYLVFADDIQFFSHGWADSSGKDGNGGVSIVCDGDKHNFLLRPDASNGKVDNKTFTDHPDWVVFDSDTNSGSCLSFEFTWVTTDAGKFWDKRWAGGGIAFDNSWQSHDFSKAKYLVLYAKTNAPGVDFNIALTGSTDSAQTGTVKLSDFAEGKKLGDSWTKVVIPIASFPSLSKLDMTQVKTIRFDLVGDYPENKPVYTHFDKIYFTDVSLATGVENLGWLRVPGDILAVWDKANDDGVVGYQVQVDGKVVGEVKGAKKRQVKIPAAYFKAAGLHTIGVGVDNGQQVSSFESVTVTAPGSAVKASVTVSATLGHPISPYLWGFNYLDGETLKKAGGTVNRWGGNATTNYNWKDDSDNRGADWYFMNSGNLPESGLEKDKRYAKTIAEDFSAGSQAIITIPLIGWVAKPAPRSGELSSYPTSMYPGQAGNDGQGSGNGQLPGGKLVWGNDPNANYLPSTPDFQEEWVKTIVGLFGPASKGGVRFYQMDNEPGIWNYNHRDVCPMGIGYDDLVDLNAKYAAAVKDADPGAQVIGFTAWGAKELAGSAWDYMPGGKTGYQLGEGAITDNGWTDRKAHGDISQFEYYLKEMAKRSKQAGKRLIDYVDDHGFPEVWGTDAKGNKVNVLGDFAYDPVLTPKQFDAMRIFWDPTFESPDSWCSGAKVKPYLWDPWVGLIPKLKKMIAENYPGTKLSMTEYYPASAHYYHGGLLEAVNLGIFMREGMDLACDWGGTEPGNYVFYGHRLFSNYDGNGSKVGGNYVDSTSSSPDLYSFAAKDKGKIYVVLVNKNHDIAQDTSITFPKAVTSYETYTLSETSGKRLFDSGAMTASGAGLELQVPAFSAILVVAR